MEMKTTPLPTTTTTSGQRDVLVWLPLCTARSRPELLVPEGGWERMKKGRRRGCACSQLRQDARNTARSILSRKIEFDKIKVQRRPCLLRVCEVYFFGGQ